MTLGLGDPWDLPVLSLVARDSSGPYDSASPSISSLVSSTTRLSGSSAAQQASMGVPLEAGIGSLLGLVERSRCIFASAFSFAELSMHFDLPLNIIFLSSALMFIFVP